VCRGGAVGGLALGAALLAQLALGHGMRHLESSWFALI
jgi:hypothetical protein